MSINGYKKKGKPAPWLSAFPGQAIKTMTKPEKLEKLRKAIRPISKKRQVAGKDYREKARAFVTAAIAKGETCPVVNAIDELRESVIYGWPCSNKLSEVHHMRGRAGSLLLDDRFWLCVSKQGHRWIHSNMDESRKRGWLCAKGDWNSPVPPDAEIVQCLPG